MAFSTLHLEIVCLVASKLFESTITNELIGTRCFCCGSKSQFKENLLDAGTPQYRLSYWEIWYFKMLASLIPFRWTYFGPPDWPFLVCGFRVFLACGASENKTVEQKVGCVFRWGIRICLTNLAERVVYQLANYEYKLSIFWLYRWIGIPPWICSVKTTCRI